MTHSEGVPAWAVPVLEALQLAHSLRTSDAVNGRCATSGEIEMADAHVRDACAAALASDAGTPEGEPFFHSLGCPRVSGRGTASHCTCPPDRERPEQTPAAESTTNAPETSTSRVDVELDWLLIEYARCQVQARYASRSQPELNRLAYAVEYAAAAIHAHVARRVREARAEGERAATGEVVGTGRVYRDLHSSMHVVPEQWHIPQDAVHPVHGIPVRVVRRDKEGV